MSTASIKSLFTATRNCISSYIVGLVSGKNRNAKDILLISAIFSTVFIVILSISFGGDSLTYYDYALFMLGEKKDIIMGRNPGFPAILIITGVTSLNSFKFLFLLQALMAALIPVFIYKSALYINKKFAFWAAIFSIVSLIPYKFIKDTDSDLPFMFFQFLGIWLCARYFYTKKIHNIYLVSLVSVCMFLLRPSATLLFVVWFFVLFISAPKKFLHIAISMLIIIGSYIGWFAIKDHFYETPKTRIAYTTGRFLFHVPYMRGLIIREENGSASQKLIECVKSDISKYFSPDNPDYNLVETLGMTNYPPSRFEYFFGRFRGHPDSLSKEIFNNPGLAYLGYLLFTFDCPEVNNMELLFFRVVYETLKANPVAGIEMYLSYFIAFAIGPQVNYTYAQESAYRIIYDIPTRFINLEPGNPAFTKGTLPQSLVKEIQYSFFKNNFVLKILAFANKIWCRMLFFLRPFVFLGMLFSGITLYRSKHFNLVSLGILTVIYQALVVIFFANPLFRYVTHTILIELMICFCGLPTLFEYTRKRLIGSDEKSI
ncbi:MAG TPA: hypothetical protein VM123_17700 [archaeon]|nr:hypothetical protein [archaeon]